MGSTDREDISAIFNEAIKTLAALRSAVEANGDQADPSIDEKIKRLEIARQVARDSVTYWKGIAEKRMARIEERQETIDALREVARSYQDKLEQRDADVEQLTMQVEMGKRALEGRDLQIDLLKRKAMIEGRRTVVYCTMCHADHRQVRATFVACGHSVCGDHVDEVIEGGA